MYWSPVQCDGCVESRLEYPWLPWPPGTRSGTNQEATSVTLELFEYVHSSQHDLPEAEEEGEGGCQEGSGQDGGNKDIHQISEGSNKKGILDILQIQA